MKLTQDQKKFYQENGFLVIENILSNEEVHSLKEAIDQFKNLKDQSNIVYEDSGNIRSVFAPHWHEEKFETLYQLSRFSIPSKELLEEDIYLYQYKLNLKKAFTGQAWEWHQDFPYWQIEDGVKQPKMLSVMIYLDDTRSYQGPLVIIPQSHKLGVVGFKEKALLKEKEKSKLENLLGVDLKYTIKEQMIKKMADDFGLISLEFGAGTAIFFHPNLFHASSMNLSPYSRDSVIITYNSLNNLPTKQDSRPAYVCSKEYASVKGNVTTF